MNHDPVEALVRHALTLRKIRFVEGHDVDTRLDFHLLDLGVYIECKRFHTDRIAEQMSRAPNVIVIQGLRAAQVFHDLLTP